MKKNSDNKKIQIFLSVIALLAVTFTYQYFKKIQHSELKDLAKSSKEKTSTQDKSTIKNQARTIASVQKSSLLAKIKDRKVVGFVSNDKDFPITNKINKEWKKLAYKKLNSLINSDIKLEITPVKSLVYVQYNMGTYVEHVKIVLRKSSGLKSAYDAYIDSQTGLILRTWNRTKFEIRPKAFLNAEGKEFVAVPLKTQSKTSI